MGIAVEIDGIGKTAEDVRYRNERNNLIKLESRTEKKLT